LSLSAVAMFGGVALNMFALQAPKVAQVVVKPKAEAVAVGDAVNDGGPATLVSLNGAAAPQPRAAGQGRERGKRGLIKAIQRELVQAGYAPGTPDGVAGMTTNAALLAYQYDHGLPMTAEPSEELLEALILGLPKVPGGSRSGLGPAAQQLVKTVQSSLEGLGFSVGRIDGQLGPMTQAAIRRFEHKSGMSPSGRISARLIRQLGSAKVSRRMSQAR